jgi:glycosyltransferase involved in cell wall biosynthesis
VSVVIVARNEAARIGRCLASVQGWVAEIVVALNDSTDDTGAIAASFGARTEQVQWKGYRDTKNVALGFATAPWVLALDADEEVSPGLRADIETFLGGADHARFAGARFPRKVWFIDRWITHGDWYPDYSLRLFRREGSCWGGSPEHDTMKVSGAIKRLHGDLFHYSFPTLSSHVAKINVFADYFLRRQQDAGQRWSVWPCLLRPAWRFFRAYFLRLGLLDGYPGLYIAVATAFGAFVRYSRLYEAERKTEPRMDPDQPCPKTP